MNSLASTQATTMPGGDVPVVVWRPRQRPGALAWGLLAVLGVLVVPPVFILLQLSVTADYNAGAGAGITLDHFAHLFADPRLVASAVNSTIFATLATLVSLAFGGVMAWLAERTNAPLKGIAWLTTILSMGTPYILYVTGWIFLFGRVGPFNEIYRTLSGNTDVLFNVHSMWGMVIIEGFLWSPLVFLMMSATFRTANGEMEEAARTSGASVLDTVWHISLRLARPAILAMAMFVFIRNIESFDVPVLVGTPGRIYLMTTDIFFSVQQVPPDLGHASSFAVLMLVVVMGLMYCYGRISRHAEKYATITGKGFRPRPFDLGRGRIVAGALFVLYFCIVLALPLLALLWMAVMPFLRPVSLAAVKFATAKHFLVVFGGTHYLELAWHTLAVAAGSATVAMVLTSLAGWLAARRHPGGALVDQLTAMPLVFPGIVLGFAMMEIALRSPIELHGTLTLLLLAFVIRYMPYGMRYAYAGVLQIHRELEEAARVGGASAMEGLRRVVVPLLSPAIVSGWLFIFLLAAKELSMAVLLAGPSSQVIAVAMFDLSTNGEGGELAAFGLVWTSLMTLCAAGLYFVMRRQSVRTFG